MEKRLKTVNFEGQSLQVREILFRCPERGLTVAYTQNNDYNVWVFNTDLPEKTFFLDNQRKALQSLAEQPTVIDLFGEVEVDEDTVCLITERVEPENLALKIAETSMIDYDIISLGISAAQVLAQLHEEGLIANCIHPENIFVDNSGAFKFTDFTLCLPYQDEENRGQQFIAQTFLSKNKENGPFRFQEGLNPRNDIRNLGLLLYAVCFGDLDVRMKEDDLSRIAFPSKPKRSYSILSSIENCLDANSLDRKALAKLLDSFQNEKRLDLHENSGSNDSTIMANISLQNLEKTPNSDTLKPGFMASLSTMVSRATTDTEGWFKSYIVENNVAPDEDYVVKILQKAWKKREKVKKLYDIIDKTLDDPDAIKSSAIVVKTLLFLHSIMSKGPVEVLIAPVVLPNKRTQTNMPIALESCSYLNYLLKRIKAEWEPIAKGCHKSKEDKLRSQALSYLIYFYSIVLTEKSKFGFDYEKVFAGNFSVEPLVKSQEVKQLFNYKTFVDLHGYCSMLLRFFKLLPEDVGVRAIQFAIAKAVTFEIYNLLGVFCHFVAMYKRIAFTFERIDRSAVERMIEGMETALENCIFRFHYCLEELKTSQAFKIYADLLPHSGLTAINEIRLIQSPSRPMESFAVDEFFPSGGSIGNFVLAGAYGNDDSPNRMISENEKLQVIRRELVKASKVNASRTTVESMVVNSPFHLSSRGLSARNAPLSSQRQKLAQDVKKPVNEEDHGKERPGVESNPSINQSPERTRPQLRKLPEKVALISITKQGAVKNPYLNARDEEVELGMNIEGIKVDEGAEDNQPKTDSKEKPASLDQNDGDNQEEKEYKVFEDSFESDKKASGRASNASLEAPSKAFDAGKALSNEFLKLVPAPTPSEDKQIQCDLDKEPDLPYSKDSFNLERFMRDEIANGRTRSSDIQDWIIKYKDLKFGKEIANGSTCTVLQGEYRGLPVGKLLVKKQLKSSRPMST